MQQQRVLVSSLGVQFGTRCACCSSDARGGVVPVDPTTRARYARPVLVPVCRDCAPHALHGRHATALRGGALLAGFAVIVLGLPDSAGWQTSSIVALVIGAVLVLGPAMSIAMGVRNLRRLARAGHHPQISISALRESTVVDTSNDALVDDLLALNPHARRAGTPQSWRQRDGGMPVARVVSRQADEQVRVDVRRDE